MVNADEILPEAEQHRTKWKDYVRDAADIFHNEEGELFEREEAIETLTEELDIEEDTAQQTLSALVTDIVDPVVQVPTNGEKYIGVVEYHEYDGAYGYCEFDDVNGTADRVVCARCVETASHDKEVTHATSGSGSFDERANFNELYDAIVGHYEQSHEVMPESVETGASLLSGTTIGGNTAFHGGNNHGNSAHNSNYITSSEAPVQDVNNQTGSVNLTTGVSSVNGQTGNVSISGGEPIGLSDADFQSFISNSLSSVVSEPATMALIASSAGAMNQITNSSGLMNTLANSQVAMEQVAGAPAAMEAIKTSQLAMNECISTGTAITEIHGNGVGDEAFHTSDLYLNTLENHAGISLSATGGISNVVSSSSDMNTIAASNTAMDEVSDSRYAMDEIAGSVTAFNAVAGDSTSRSQIEASQAAINALNSFTTFFSDSDSNTNQSTFKTVEPMTNSNGVWIETATTSGRFNSVHRRKTVGGTQTTTTGKFVFDVDHTANTQGTAERTATTEGQSYRP